MWSIQSLYQIGATWNRPWNLDQFSSSPPDYPFIFNESIRFSLYTCSTQVKWKYSSRTLFSWFFCLFISLILWFWKTIGKGIVHLFVGWFAHEHFFQVQSNLQNVRSPLCSCNMRLFSLASPFYHDRDLNVKVFIWYIKRSGLFYGFFLGTGGSGWVKMRGTRIERLRKVTVPCLSRLPNPRCRNKMKKKG